MMRNAIAVALAAGLALANVPVARSQSVHHQPYAGHQTREIKALSEQQMADLRAGRGMSLALAAELNGYPGPLHALEHADALGLSPAQRQRVKILFDTMKAEAIALGEQLIQQEAELDSLFARKAVQPASLEGSTAAIGITQGALRATHLRYHLAMMDVLTPEQVTRYAELRGYSGSHGTPAPGHHGSHPGR